MGRSGYNFGKLRSFNDMATYATIIRDQEFEGDFSRFNGSADDNALGLGGTTRKCLIDSCRIDACGVAEGLKLTHISNVTIRNTTIIGGYEDCVDIVRGDNILFENCIFAAKGTKHHFTIKCESRDIKIKDCTFKNDFNNAWDGALVDMGNWSNYDKKDLIKTKNIQIINCKLENISWWKRILTRRLYSKNASTTNTQGFNLKIPNFIVKLFWRLRRWQTRA